jgi:hypothetical protein
MASLMGQPRLTPGVSPPTALRAVLIAAAVVAGCAGGDAAPTGGAGAGGTQAAGGAGSGDGGGGGAGAGGEAGACATPPAAHMTWTVGHDAMGAEVSCEEAGAATVQMFMNATRFEFPCAAKSGSAPNLTAGESTPRVLLTGVSGAVLSQGNLPTVTIPGCGVTELGRIRFVVAAGGAAGAGGTGAGGAAGGAGGGGGAGTGPCDALPIFASHNCSVDMACHDAKGSAAAFDMESAGWEKLLVGRLPKAGGASGLGSACVDTRMPYLVAGSKPARGLFLDKLANPTQTCGARMPLLPPVLNAGELDCVQRWANGLTAK